MKKKLTLLLITAMAVTTLAACGNTNSDADTDTDTDTTATEESIRDLDTAQYVTLGEYKGLTVTVDPVAEVTEDDITDYINTNFLSSYAESTDITDRAVAVGDAITYSCVGTMDGVAFDGGSTAEGETWSATVGAGNVISDLDDGFVGMMVGETKEIPCTFPENYEESLAGQDAVFTVTIESATETTYPELTAELLTEINSGYTDVEEARAATREYLEGAALDTYDSNVESALLSEVLMAASFQTPPQFLVDKNVAALRQNLEYYASMYGMEFADFLSALYGMTEDDFTEQAELIGAQAANETLAIEAIADAEGLGEVSEDELVQAAEEYISNSGYYADVDALFADVDRDTFRDYVVSQRVQAWLVENNTVVNG